MTNDLYSLKFISSLLQIDSSFTITSIAVASLMRIYFFDVALLDNVVPRYLKLETYSIAIPHILNCGVSASPFTKILLLLYDLFPFRKMILSLHSSESVRFCRSSSEPANKSISSANFKLDIAIPSDLVS